MQQGKVPQTEKKNCAHMCLDTVKTVCQTLYMRGSLWSMNIHLVGFIWQYFEDHFRKYVFPPFNTHYEPQCAMLDEEGIKDDQSPISIYVKRNGYRCLHSNFQRKVF